MNTSLFELFKIGIGPSSSHTVGPMRAALRFVDDLGTTSLQATHRIQAELYGSLAHTGIGHGTDRAVLLGLSGERPDTVDPSKIDGIVANIRSTGTLTLNGSQPIPFRESTDLLFQRDRMYPPGAEAATSHPNGMRFTAFDGSGTAIAQQVFYSVGGGFILSAAELAPNPQEKSVPPRTVPYPFASAAQLLAVADANHLTIAELILANEVALANSPGAPPQSALSIEVGSTEVGPTEVGSKTPEDRVNQHILPNHLANSPGAPSQSALSIEVGSTEVRSTTPEDRVNQHILPNHLANSPGAPSQSALSIEVGSTEVGSTEVGSTEMGTTEVGSKTPEDRVNQHILAIWHAMQSCTERGIATEGILPGGLNVRRRAPRLYQRILALDRSDKPRDPLAPLDWVSLFAIAVNEENAAGGRVVTAPTNGAAGVIPAIAHYYMRFIETDKSSEEKQAGLLRYFLTAAAIGILYKENASISGAEVGCQGEVGVACSMAAGGLVAALSGTNAQVEHAAEIAMEHNLGMTCDPIGGLVQIPCIERNAMGAVKAVNACRMAMHETEGHKLSLDQVIETMYRTGMDMQSRYKETSLAGLALNIIEC